MNRYHLLALSLCLGFPAAGWAADSGCAAGAACQEKLQDPDTSALAPAPSPDNSTLVKSGPDNRQALANNHDDDLFVSPSKPEVLTDPFSQESARPLINTPQQQ